MSVLTERRRRDSTSLRYEIPDAANERIICFTGLTKSETDRIPLTLKGLNTDSRNRFLDELQELCDDQSRHNLNHREMEVFRQRINELICRYEALVSTS